MWCDEDSAFTFWKLTCFFVLGFKSSSLTPSFTSLDRVIFTALWVFDLFFVVFPLLFFCWTADCSLPCWCLPKNLEGFRFPVCQRLLPYINTGCIFLSRWRCRFCNCPNTAEFRPRFPTRICTSLRCFASWQGLNQLVFLRSACNLLTRGLSLGGSTFVCYWSSESCWLLHHEQSVDDLHYLLA